MASGIARRVGRICLLAAVVGSVAGCVGMPGNGPDAKFTATPQTTQQGNNFTGPFPLGPQGNGSPSQIVNGFLLASASYPAYSPVAGEYLVGSVARTWNPTSVTVFSAFNVVGQGSLAPTVPHGARRAWVDVAIAVQAALNGSAQYVSAQDQSQPKITYQFILVKVNGQWRISDPPPYRMVNAGDFPSYYRAQDLYFFDQADTALVPDSVFVPLGASVQQLATNLVDALTAKPTTPWLASAADTEFPAGTKVVSVVVDGATATVDLAGAAASADAKTRELIAAQLVWTLTGSPASPSTIQSVVLEVDGKQFTPDASPCPGGRGGQATFQTQAAYQCYNPYMSAPTSFYYVSQGQPWSRCGSESLALQGSIGPVIPVVGRTGSFASSRCDTGRYVPEASAGPPPAQPRSLRALSMAAVSPDGKYLAIVSPGSDALYIGTRSGNAASFPNTPRLTGAGISSLSWDHSDDLWVAQGGYIYMLQAAGTGFEQANFSGGQVSELSVAPDGVRIALIVPGNGPGRELEVAAIDQSGPQTADQRGAPMAHPLIGTTVPLGASVANPTALTWYGADNLIVVDQASSGNTLWEVPLDGQPAAGPLVTPAGTVSITADGAANVLVAGLSTNGTGQLAVSTGLEGPWQTLGEPGEDPAYPG